MPIAELLAVCAQRLRQSQASLSAASDQVKNEDGKKMTTTKKKSIHRQSLAAADCKLFKVED